MKQDLAKGTIVLCRPMNSEYWKVRYYLGEGKTTTDLHSNIVDSGWLYVVPLNYFRPTDPQWRPIKQINWAEEREEEVL